MLTHGDLRPGNVIWNGGRAVVIDFDEPVWGPAALDLARAGLELSSGHRPTLLTALLEGYRQEHPLAAVWDARLPELMTAWSAEDGDNGATTGSGAVVSLPRLLERLDHADF